MAGPTDAAPQVLKAIAPVRHPAETMALIDVDMIVTRPLTELIEPAAAGAVVAGGSGLDRFCPEWAELLDLGPLTRRPYVSTGLVVAGGDLGRELVRIVDERRGAVDFELTFWRRNVAEYPLVHADQDLINAAICARAGDGQLIVFDPRLSASPPFTRPAGRRRARPALRLRRRGRALRRPPLARQTVARADPPRRLLAPAAPAAGRRGARDQGPRAPDPAALPRRAARLRRAHPHQRARAVSLPRARAAGRALEERQPLKAAFYCVADSRYFLGAVGLVNSLRLVGHREPIYLLDCGLDDEQRRLLEREVELVAAPAEAPPWLRKTVAPLSRPAEVAVLVDADMVIARPLDELIDRAAGGRVIAFRDRQQRFFSEWGDLLGLGHGPARSVRLIRVGVLRRLDRPPGPRAARRAPIAGRLRAHLLAPQRPRLSVPVRGPGRPQRHPRHARGARAGGGARPPARRHPPVPRPADRATSARSGAPTATAPSPTSSTSTCASRGSRRPTTASTRGSCDGC